MPDKGWDIVGEFSTIVEIKVRILGTLLKVFILQSKSSKHHLPRNGNCNVGEEWDVDAAGDRKSKLKRIFRWIWV